MNSATGYLKKKKKDENYLSLDSTDEYKEVRSGIRSEIKTFNGRKKTVLWKNHAKLGINTDDNLPLKKPLKFQTLTVIIRCVFQEGEKLYPHVYLGEYLYEL